MADTLRTLIISNGDVAHVTEILHTLRTANYTPDSEVVDNPMDMRTAGQRGGWDAVIVDYPLIDFPELTLLPAMATGNQVVPCLLVATRPSDDLIVRAVKAGVHDVIARDRLDRLVPVLQREMTQAEARRKRRREEDAREVSFTNLLSTLDGIITSLNERADVANAAAPHYQHTAQLACAVAALSIRVARHDDVSNAELAKLLPAGTGSGKLETVNPGDAEGGDAGLLNFLPPTQREIVSALAATVEKRDPYTAGHQRRVADIAVAVAREMGLPKQQIDGIRVAGLLHDIGKICIPGEILRKPGKLTDTELALVKTHPSAGFDILKSIPFPWPVAQIVLQHQERDDGSGYPEGLTADELLLESRIIAVADVMEAISSKRAYRASHGLERALEELSLFAGVRYHPDAAAACIKVFQK